MTLTTEQRTAVVRVFTEYLDNAHEQFVHSDKTWGDVLSQCASSDGPGPDFFPAIELALKQHHHASCEHVMERGHCVNCSYPD